MEPERYVLPPECVDAIVATHAGGGRVVAVGTTVVRTLEHAARGHGGIEAATGCGSADLFICPGFEFCLIDAMLTNFHLPRATPILLVSALMGRERLLEAYDYAIDVARGRKGARIQGARPVAPQAYSCSTSRSPTERNAVDAPLPAPAVAAR